MTPATRRDALAALFLQNTGHTTVKLPNINTNPVKLCGWQPARTRKIQRWP